MTCNQPPIRIKLIVIERKEKPPFCSLYNISRGPLKRTPEKTSVPCYVHKVVFKTFGLLNTSIKRLIAKADQKSAHQNKIYCQGMGQCANQAKWVLTQHNLWITVPYP
jgi:hypothetical protein